MVSDDSAVTTIGRLVSGKLIVGPHLWRKTEGQHSGVYGGVQLPVRRTNIYLTEAEQAGLDARAAVEGSNRSDDDDELDEALASAAGQIAKLARSLTSRDPNLRIQ